MLSGKFITVEGVEGAGKSTVLKYIDQHLQNAGIQAAFTREPGGTELAEKIRNVLLHPETDEQIEPNTELLLMFACREQHIKQRIQPWLQSGKWVVSDRYIDATYAYQGGGRGMNIQFIADLDRHIVNHLYPDLTLLLDLPPEVGFERAAQRGNGKDRIESEKIDFFNRVRDTYLQRAKQDPNRIKIIDASQSLSIVETQVATTLDTFISGIRA